MQKILNVLLSVKREEYKLLIYSLLFILSLFASYALLRPLRDTLGLEGGSEELKWLFLATFIATLLGSILAMNVSGIVKRRLYLNAIFLFFTFNLVLFYIAWLAISKESEAFLWLGRIFYVWVSVFNLFIISSAWSLLADIFTQDRSRRLFGIITAGASLGSIMGAFSVSFLAPILSTQNFLLASILLLFVALLLKNLLIKESYYLLDNSLKENFLEDFKAPLSSKNPFIALKLIAQSKYLLALVGFILLLTAMSTFLYMEQARIISSLFPRGLEGAREARMSAFASIDLIVQTASFILQIFITAKIVQFLGIKWLLSTLGILVGIGFIALSCLPSTPLETEDKSLLLANAFANPSFLAIVIVMSLRRIGEYALVKPGREMLFVPLSNEEKYKVKNFLDTVVYRGGDALSAQLEGLLLKVSLSCVLLSGAVLSFINAWLGKYLAKNYEHLTPSKKEKYEKN